MKILRLVALALALFAAPVIKAQNIGPQSNVDKVSAATLAVYQGKEECKWQAEEGFFSIDYVWACKFQTHFTCTATVIKTDGDGTYVGLTAGHCFNKQHDQDYYVADGIADQPVLRHISLRKYEVDDRYDFAVFTFYSHHTYPVIEVDFDSPVPAIGTRVLNVNFALGLTKQVVTGAVVSDTITEPIPQLKGTKGMFLASVGVGPGASGSAVVDDTTGKIVGIVKAVFPSTQMPTLIMPTGKTFTHFLEDDSAGVKEPPPSGTPPSEPEAPIVESHKPADFVFVGLLAVLSTLLSVVIGKILITYRKKIKDAVVRLYSRLRSAKKV